MILYMGVLLIEQAFECKSRFLYTCLRVVAPLGMCRIGMQMELAHQQLQCFSKSASIHYQIIKKMDPCSISSRHREVPHNLMRCVHSGHWTNENYGGRRIAYRHVRFLSA